MGEDDLRSDIESALGESSDDASGAPASIPSSTPSAEPDAAPGAESAESAADRAVPSSAAPVAERDSLGRFLPKKEGAAPAAAGQPTPSVPAGALVTPTPAAAPTQPEIPAPASLGPLAREHWAATPQPIREYVAQREMQMQRWANDTAPARNAGQAFMQAIEPHRMTIQAEGVDPITAVVNLMQFATMLRFGTSYEKADLLSKVVKAYGIDVQALDSALAGVVPPPGQQPQINVQAEVQRYLAPLHQMAAQRQQAEQQQIEYAAHTDLVSFASDPKHEFIDDVRLTMADMIDVAAKQGYTLPLQDAYDRSCLLHPEVSKIIMARRQGASAQQLTAAAQRAKAAAVSVRGTAPVGSPNGSEPSSIRDSIEAAIEHHSRV